MSDLAYLMAAATTLYDEWRVAEHATDDLQARGRDFPDAGDSGRGAGEGDLAEATAYEDRAQADYEAVYAAAGRYLAVRGIDDPEGAVLSALLSAESATRRRDKPPGP